MVNPQLMGETAVSLSDIQEYVAQMEKRSPTLDLRTTKTKEFVESFATLSKEKRDKLRKKLAGLDILRLKEAQIVKILDFLPTTADDVRILLQGYPVSLSKKDMERIVEVVTECT